MASKKETVDQSYIISKYMDHVLMNEKMPKSVYAFCKDIDISEEVFYNFFGSLKSINKTIWHTFYVNTMDVANKNKEYVGFSSREKMLTFFFTFFEILTLNRSYVLFVLSQDEKMLKNVTQLRGLRRDIKSFTSDLITSDNEGKQFKIAKNSSSLFSEGAWVQFLFLLKFWMDDESPSFEKTDIAIEKSVHTIFDVFDNTPMNAILDFGKFLWKEKVM